MFIVLISWILATPFFSVSWDCGQLGKTEKEEFDAQSDDGENVGFREENAQDPDSKYSGPKHSPAEYDSVLIRVICRLLAVNTHYQVVRATCRVSHTDSEENIAILSQL